MKKLDLSNGMRRRDTHINTLANHGLCDILLSELNQLYNEYAAFQNK